MFIHIYDDWPLCGWIFVLNIGIQDDEKTDYRLLMMLPRLFGFIQPLYGRFHQLWVSLVIIHFSEIFPYKPSSYFFGTPHDKTETPIPPHDSAAPSRPVEVICCKRTTSHRHRLGLPVRDAEGDCWWLGVASGSWNSVTCGREEVGSWIVDRSIYIYTNRKVFNFQWCT